jgi:hypothetical protein
MVLALAASLMVVGVYAAPSTPAKAKGVTVGDFAVKVAAALQYDSSTPQVAAGALARRGITLATDLSTPMTQGEAARVLADLGINAIAPKNSSDPVTAQQAGTLAGLISTMSVSSSASGPALPDACLHSQNRGQCVECCKSATGCGAPPAPFDCNQCSKFCHNNVPPPISPGEPTP